MANVDHWRICCCVIEGTGLCMIHLRIQSFRIEDTNEPLLLLFIVRRTNFSRCIHTLKENVNIRHLHVKALEKDFCPTVLIYRLKKELCT